MGPEKKIIIDYEKGMLNHRKSQLFLKLLSNVTKGFEWRLYWLEEILTFSKNLNKNQFCEGKVQLRNK